jgi:transposase
MLRRTEKEQRVIELYQQGKTIREIAQEVHMSFADIGSIIRKFTKLDDANKPQEKDPIALISKDTQAFKLFSEGKKPIEVAIKLDLGADIVGRLYQQFWRLEGLYQLTTIF